MGLSRGVDGLEIYVMRENPNNVLQIDEFSAIFNGFSIGCNDRTQLTPGVSCDCAIVAFDLDERRIRLAVEGGRRTARLSGLCGQAPSEYPEYVEFLARLGIDSLSRNPDAIVRTTQRILTIETELTAATHPLIKTA